jgi:hypothetical protein
VCFWRNISGKMSDPIEEVTDAIEEVTEQITEPVKQKRVMSDKQKESLKLAREKAFLYRRSEECVCDGVMEAVTWR